MSLIHIDDFSDITLESNHSYEYVDVFSQQGKKTIIVPEHTTLTYLILTS